MTSYVMERDGKTRAQARAYLATKEQRMGHLPAADDDTAARTSGSRTKEIA